MFVFFPEEHKFFILYVSLCFLKKRDMDKKPNTKEKTGKSSRNTDIGGGGKYKRYWRRESRVSAYTPPDQTVSTATGRTRKFSVTSAKQCREEEPGKREKLYYDSLHPMRSEKKTAAAADDLLTGGPPVGATSLPRPAQQESPPQPPVIKSGEEVLVKASDTAAGNDDEESMESETYRKKRSRSREPYEDETDNETAKKTMRELPKIEKYSLEDAEKTIEIEDELEATTTGDYLQNKEKKEKRSAVGRSTWGLTMVGMRLSPEEEAKLIRREVKETVQKRLREKEAKEDAEKRRVLTKVEDGAEKKTVEAEEGEEKTATEGGEEKKTAEAVDKKVAEAGEEKKEAEAEEGEERKNKQEELRAVAEEEKSCQHIEQGTVEVERLTLQEEIEQLKRQTDELEREKAQRKELTKKITEEIEKHVTEREELFKTLQNEKQSHEDEKQQILSELQSHICKLETDTMEKLREKEETISKLKNAANDAIFDAETEKLEKQRIINKQNESLSYKDTEISKLKSQLSKLTTENQELNSVLVPYSKENRPETVTEGLRSVTNMDGMLQNYTRRIEELNTAAVSEMLQIVQDLIRNGNQVAMKQKEMDKGIQEVSTLAKSTLANVKALTDDILSSQNENKKVMEESTNALKTSSERTVAAVVGAAGKHQAFTSDDADEIRILFSTNRQRLVFLLQEAYSDTFNLYRIAHDLRNDEQSKKLVNDANEMVIRSKNYMDKNSELKDITRFLNIKVEYVNNKTGSPTNENHTLLEDLSVDVKPETDPTRDKEMRTLLKYAKLASTAANALIDNVTNPVKSMTIRLMDTERQRNTQLETTRIFDHLKLVLDAVPVTQQAQPQTDYPVSLDKITKEFKTIVENIKRESEEKIWHIRKIYEEKEDILKIVQDEKQDKKRDEDCINKIFSELYKDFEEKLDQILTTRFSRLDYEIRSYEELNQDQLMVSSIDNLKDTLRDCEREVEEKFRELSMKLIIDFMNAVRERCSERALGSPEVGNILVNIERFVLSKEITLTQKRVEAIRRVTHLKSPSPSSPMDISNPLEENKEGERIGDELRSSISNALSMAASEVALEDIQTKRSINATLVGSEKNNPVKVTIKNSDTSKTGGQFVPNFKSEKDETVARLRQQHQQRQLLFTSSSFRREANNSLTPTTYNELITTKVFPYSKKNETLLYHPENLRNWRDTSAYPSADASLEEKKDFVVDFTSMLEYSMFNNNSGNDDEGESSNISSRLIYTIFEHDVVVCKHVSNVLSSFRDFITTGETIALSDKGSVKRLMEATVTSVFSCAIPLIHPFASQVACSLIKPVSDDIRLRTSYALITLIERFLECASKRAHTLRGAMDASGLTHKLSLFPAKADLERVSSFDVRYNYALLYSLLQMVSFNLSHIIETGIRQIKTVVMSLAAVTLTDNRTLVPVKDGITKLYEIVPDSKQFDKAKIMAVLEYTFHITGNKNKDSYDIDSMGSTLKVIQSLIKTIFDNETMPGYTNSFLSIDISNKDGMEAALKELTEVVITELSKEAAPQLLVDSGKDAILMDGATVIGKLGQSAVNAVISFSKPRGDLMLFWPDVQFRGGVSEVNLWALSGGGTSSSTTVNVNYSDYRLSFPRDAFNTSHYIKPSQKDDSVHRITRTINNSMMLGFRSRNDASHQAGRVGLALYSPNNGVSFVIEEANKERYINLINNLVIKPMVVSGLMPVKESMRETPRSYLSQNENGLKWVNNPNRAVIQFPVSKWKLPSATLLYSMLSEKDRVNEEKLNQAKQLQKISESKDRRSAGIAEFMGGSAGSSFLSVLDRETECPSIEMRPGEMKRGKSTWTTDKDGITTLDPMSMVMVGRSSGVNRGGVTASGNAYASDSQTVPYDRAVIALEVERTQTPQEWWSYGIRQSKREEAIAIVSFLKHKFFVLTPIF